MINKKTYPAPAPAPAHKTIILGALLAALSFKLNAAPITLDLTGTITDATGTRATAGDLGTSVTTNLVFDLDPANAAAYVYDPPAPGDAESAKWYFVGAPYSAITSGNFGTINESRARVETYDNFDADAFGNPFGLTGIVDILSIWGGSFTVDCTGGTSDPITGCSLDDAPLVSGVEFSVNLFHNSLWFSGVGETDLPSSIPDFSELIGIFGNTFYAAGGEFVGQNDVTYQPLAVSAVPVPAAVWLFCTALVGLVGFSKRRKAA